MIDATLRARAVARVAAGERALPVARDLGVSVGAVLRAARAAGVPTARAGNPGDGRSAQAVALARAEDITLAAAARRLGVPLSSAYGAKYRAMGARR